MYSNCHVKVDLECFGRWEMQIIFSALFVIGHLANEGEKSTVRLTRQDLLFEIIFQIIMWLYLERYTSPEYCNKINVQV